MIFHSTNNIKYIGIAYCIQFIIISCTPEFLLMDDRLSTIISSHTYTIRSTYIHAYTPMHLWITSAVKPSQLVQSSRHLIYITQHCTLSNWPSERAPTVAVTWELLSLFFFSFVAFRMRDHGRLYSRREASRHSRELDLLCQLKKLS